MMTMVLGERGEKAKEGEDNQEHEEKKRQPYYLKLLELALKFQYGQSILQDPSGLSFNEDFGRLNENNSTLITFSYLFSNSQN